MQGNHCACARRSHARRIVTIATIWSIWSIACAATEPRAQSWSRARTLEARQGAAMAYDAVAGRCLLFGGRSGINPTGDHAESGRGI